jgi:hypothetical protein
LSFIRAVLIRVRCIKLMTINWGSY